MVSKLTIETIEPSDYNYSITYKSGNTFSLILISNASFTKRLQLKISFLIISTLIN